METFADPTGLSVSNFNIGGVRVRLDNNREVSLFDVWSSYTNPWIGYLIDENADDVAAGVAQRHSAADVVAGDAVQTQSIADFLSYIEHHTEGHDDLAIVSGDLNTVAASDWTDEWANCQSHYGLSYDLPATVQFTEAGMIDVYRTDNPDVCTAPGVTWSPREVMTTPQRIDLMYARGTDLAVLDSTTIDQRMPEHGEGRFYSDHAAIVADLQVGSTAPGGNPDPTEPDESDGGGAGGGGAAGDAADGDDAGQGALDDHGAEGDGNEQVARPEKPTGLPATGSSG